MTIKKPFNIKLAICIIAAIIIVLAVLFVVLANGLGIPLPYYGPHWDLFSVAAFNVAGSNSMGTEIEPLEKDNEGRVLFEVCFAGEQIERLYYPEKDGYGRLYAYVVCQKVSNDAVYYYAENCFSVFSEQSGFTDSERQLLKDRNDWNKPIENEKLTSRPILDKRHDMISVRPDSEANRVSNISAEKAFVSHVSLEKGDHIHTVLLDIDDEGRMLYLMWISSDNRDSKGWFMLRMPGSSQYKDSELAEINDPMNYEAELKTFKEAGDWNSPIPKELIESSPSIAKPRQ